MFATLRAKWVEQLRGDQPSSTRRQIIDATRDLAFFGMLSELGSRDQQEQLFNAQLGYMLALGYAYRQALAIRRLVDRDKSSNSLKVVINSMKGNITHLTRRNVVGHDGCPWNADEAERQLYADQWRGDAGEAPGVVDPELLRKCMDSGLRNEAFDAISRAGAAGRNDPGDRVSEAVLDRLLDELKTPTIKRVTTFVDKVVAHAEAGAQLDHPDLSPTFGDIKESIRTLVRVQTFLLGHVLFESSGSVVPVPQFDHLAYLDKPVIPPDQFLSAHGVWRAKKEEIDEWAHDVCDLARRP